MLRPIASHHLSHKLFGRVQPHRGLPTPPVTFAEPGTTFITFIFPDLIVTMLAPGELITQVSLPDLSVVSDVRAIAFSQDPEGQLSERAKYSRMSYIGLRLS